MTDGKKGELPDWYLVDRAARRYQQPPWVMAKLPETAGHHWWIEWALIAESSEAEAQEEFQRIAARKERAKNLGRARR